MYNDYGHMGHHNSPSSASIAAYVVLYLIICQCVLSCCSISSSTMSMAVVGDFIKSIFSSGTHEMGNIVYGVGDAASNAGNAAYGAGANAYNTVKNARLVVKK